MNNNFLHQIDKQLTHFPCHGLQDNTNTVLMDRVDTKFILPESSLFWVLHELEKHCTVLDFDGRKISRYENIYFDTHDLDFYHAHHNGKSNRFKVRCRTYKDIDTSFSEVKLKNNKKRTIKERVRVSAPNETLISDHQEFLYDQGILDANRLCERQKCCYSRIAFSSEASSERVTIDFDLRFKGFSESKKANPEGYQSLGQFVIVELKQAYLSRNTDIYNILRSRRIRPQSFSKYCMGMTLLLGDELKSNRFKEIGLKVDRLSALCGDQLNG